MVERRSGIYPSPVLNCLLLSRIFLNNSDVVGSGNHTFLYMNPKTTGNLVPGLGVRHMYVLTPLHAGFHVLTLPPTFLCFQVSVFHFAPSLKVMANNCAEQKYLKKTTKHRKTSF